MRANTSKTGAKINHEVGKFNYVLIGLLVALPTIFGFIGKAAEMGVIIVACSLALCFANLHRIESFKGAGFEARMRKVVEDAYATLEVLQNLARPLLRTNIASVTHSHRWSGSDREREHELLAELKVLIDSLELTSDPEIDYMIRDFYNHYAADHIRFVMEVLRIAGVENEAVARSVLPYLVRSETYTPPSGEMLRSALSGLTAPQLHLLEPFIQDYEHYIRTHTFRRDDALWASELPDAETLRTQANG